MLQGIKADIFENLQTIRKMQSCLLWVMGKLLMKSIELDSQVLDGTDRGWCRQNF
jgi:hypothetical protein